MKKSKILGLVTFSLLLLSAGTLSSFDSKEEIKIQKTIKNTESLVNNGHIKDIAISRYHSGAIVTDSLGNDSLYMWGSNDYGQLGLGNKTDYTTPQRVAFFPSTMKLKDLELGEEYSMIVVEDLDGKDHLYTWGRNDKGQLGTGNTTEKTSPTEIYFSAGLEVKKIAAGTIKTSGAILTDYSGDDHLYMWGSNEYGQLGLNSSTTYYSSMNEVMSANSSTIKEINDLEIGESFAVASTTDYSNDDHVYTWGKNDAGQLGNGSEGGSVKYPLEVNRVYFNSNFEVIDLEVGNGFVLALIETSSGEREIYSWGNNHFGQLGIGGDKNTSIPSKISSFSSNYEMESISAAGSQSTAVLVDKDGNDHVYGWGHNEAYQLGFNAGNNVYLPTEFFVGKEVKQIEKGYGYSVGVLTDEEGNDHFYAWGRNNYGQLGNGTTNSGGSLPSEVNILGENDSIRTTFIERTSETEFTFEIELSNAEGFDSESVNIYNSKGIVVGETSNEESVTRESSAYLYNSNVTDLDNAANENIYWSVDGGETLNLISTNSFPSMSTDDSHVVLYSSLGVGFVILLILIIVFVVLFLSKDNEKEDNSNDYMGSNEKKSRKEKKSKKQREQEQANQRNNVLDAF